MPSTTTVNGGSHVSSVVIRALARSTPSAVEINACLLEIASDSGVSWEPEPTRHNVYVIAKYTHIFLQLVYAVPAFCLMHLVAQPHQ